MIRKKILWALLFIVLLGSFSFHQSVIRLFLNRALSVPETSPLKSISNNIEQGETLFSIFTKHGLRIEELFAMKNAAASIHPLRELQPGKPYSITVDEQNFINSFTYGIDDDTILKIERVENVFQAHKYNIPYETRILTIGGSIEDNLISAIGTQRDDYLFALHISDIFAWDIDFNTDLRAGDTFRIIVEGLYLNGEFKRYGKILSAEFVNNSQRYTAYRFEYDGKDNYYDAAGKSLRKFFLKAPLSFRRVSSSYSNKRLHPILKIYRPHHGIDYVAAAGTPVSATADGTVSFAGYEGDYGNLVTVTHHNGYKTYYGHLSRIKKGILKSKQVKQGDLLGYVGSTGLSNSPHLHYEMRQGNTAINPRRIKHVASEPIPSAQMAEFGLAVGTLNRMFASSVFYDPKLAESKKHSQKPAKIADYNFQSRTKQKGS